MRRLALGVALAIGVVAVVLSIGASALAAPTKVTWPVAIHAQAAPGTTNRVVIQYRFVEDLTNGGAWTHAVRDGAAGVTTVVTEPPTCYPLTRANPFYGEWVRCPDGSSGQGQTDATTPKGQGESFSISLGDRNDTFAADSVGDFEVHGGPGRDLVIGNDEPSVVPAMEDEPRLVYWTEDMLYGDGGNDLLAGRQGSDYLSGGAGADYLEGGPDAGESDAFSQGKDDALLGGGGNDKLNAAEDDRDSVINCGPGRRDKAWIDKIDPKPKGCEIVKKRPPRPSELRDELDALCKLGGECIRTRSGS
jgi:hypothetical protein